MQLALNGYIKYSQTKSMKQRTKSIFMSKHKFSRSLHLSIYPIDWTLIGDTMTIENWSSLWQTNFLQPNKMFTRDDLHYDMDICILTNCFLSAIPRGKPSRAKVLLQPLQTPTMEHPKRSTEPSQPKTDRIIYWFMVRIHNRCTTKHWQGSHIRLLRSEKWNH